MTWPLMTYAETAVQDDEHPIAGKYLNNTGAAMRAASAVGLPFHIMCALLEKEGWLIDGKVGGHNIYGHDIGGVFRVQPPAVRYVTEENFAEFYRRVVVNGERSNGVGPMQITYRGYFPMMRDMGLKAWLPQDNMFFGAQVFHKLLNAHGQSIRRAGCAYNTGSPSPCDYGDRLVALVDKWKARLN